MSKTQTTLTETCPYGCHERATNDGKCLGCIVPEAPCNTCGTECVEVQGQTLMLCPKCDALPIELERAFVEGRL